MDELAQLAHELIPTYLKDTFYKPAVSRGSHAHGSFQAAYETIRDRSAATKLFYFKNFKQQDSNNGKI